MIVYHNINKFENKEFYQDIWSDAQTPYLSNEKDIYLKMTVDPEAVEKAKQAVLDTTQGSAAG